MARLNYHASHEQFAPSALLQYVVEAERAGFTGAFSSDHFNPWLRSQGQSGATWPWLGAAMQATRDLQFSAITVPGGWRYRPAVLAQSMASLAEMFPGRLPWVALGSGQALNERVGAAPWPGKRQRNEALRNSATLIRQLLDGEQITQQVPSAARNARLWSRGATTPSLMIAAMTPQTAQWIGGWADGMLTVGVDLPQLAQMVKAFHEGGGNGKAMHLKIDLSWAKDEETAWRQAHEHWRFCALPPVMIQGLERPEDFEEATRYLQPADLRGHVLPACDPSALAAHLRACAALGFASFDLHHVGPDQIGFIQWIGQCVLPLLDTP